MGGTGFGKLPNLAKIGKIAEIHKVFLFILSGISRISPQIALGFAQVLISQSAYAYIRQHRNYLGPVKLAWLRM
jgi:hypothetical protein